MSWNPTCPSKKVEIFQDGEIGVKTEFLSDITELASSKIALAPNVVPRNGSVAGRWTTEATEHPHRRGFSGSIRSEEPEDFAFGN